jgi:hypothetical protein
MEVLRRRGRKGRGRRKMWEGLGQRKGQRKRQRKGQRKETRTSSRKGRLSLRKAAMGRREWRRRGTSLSRLS